MDSSKQLSLDSWSNLFTGIGVSGSDRRLETTFNFNGFLDENTINSLYTDNGFAAKIVDRFVEDMMRKGFKINGDEEGIILQRFDELGLWQKIEELLKWDRLHGGALMVLGIEDGSEDLEEPLNEQNIYNIEFSRVYDRWSVYHELNDINVDYNSSNYGEVEKYVVMPRQSYRSKHNYKVHVSRCIVLNGISLPSRLATQNKGWGASIYQKGFQALRQLGDMYDSIESIVSDFVTQSITMDNLMSLIAAGQEETIKRRLALIDMSRSVYNTTLLDKEEKFDKTASSVTGLPEVLDRYIQHVAGVYDIPVRILTGQQSGGLNNQGEGETRDWYDKIAAKQRSYYTPMVLERLVKLLFNEKKGKFKGIEPETWSIEHNPLYEISEKERSEIYRNNSDADCNYVRDGILQPEEVAVSRFGSDKYGEKIELITTDRKIDNEANIY